MADALVAFASNRSFELPLAVALRSLAQHHSGPVAVITDGIDTAGLARLRVAAVDLDVRRLEIRPEEKGRFPASLLQHSA